MPYYLGNISELRQTIYAIKYTNICSNLRGNCIIQDDIITKNIQKINNSCYTTGIIGKDGVNVRKKHIANNTTLEFIKRVKGGLNSIKRQPHLLIVYPGLRKRDSCGRIKVAEITTVLRKRSSYFTW